MAEAAGHRLGDKRMVLAVVALAMFITNLDSTVIATVIPVMARDLGSNPIHMKLALTSYLLALAVFIPACGWAADRFGARNVFCTAMVVFTVGSIFCALSETLWQLVLARLVQGAGGAMLVPVGRIVVLKSLPRSEMISALALLALPQLIAPVIGPPVGGFIATYASWQWIFWFNVPIAAACLVFAFMHIPNMRGDGKTTFDWVGFALIGPGLAAVLAGISLVGVDLISPTSIVILVAFGAFLLAWFVRHAVKAAAPLLDLSLLRISSFRNGVLAAFMFRASIGCAAFLVPLVLQEGLGKSAFESGMITLVLGIGAMSMKFIGPPVLKQYGFRQVMMPNAAACAIFAAVPALFVLDPPTYLIMGALLLTSLSRSLQFVATNAVIYADIPDDRIASATTCFAVVVELSGAVGIAVAAAVMQSYQIMKGTTALASDDFVLVFMFVALVSAGQIIPLSRLAADTGDSMRNNGKTEATSEPAAKV